MTDHITAEQMQELMHGAPKVSAILRDQASLARDLRLGSNLHRSADWIDCLARALIASEAARKLAEDRLAKAVQAAIDALKGDSNLDVRLCCDGRECGCQGATFEDYVMYALNALRKDTP